MADEQTKSENIAERRFMLRGALVLVATTLVGVGFYFWLVFSRWSFASEWGNFGSAVGPFAALLNVGALLAAIYSIALQREELRETRAEMVSQGKQFEKTAEAQERLAGSQERLARAQEDGNGLTRAATGVQRRANIVAATAALPHITTAKRAAPDDANREAFSGLVDGLLLVIRCEMQELDVKSLHELVKEEGRSDA